MLLVREIKLGLLWIGNAQDCCEYSTLFGHGIRAIVQLAYEEPPIAPPRELLYLRFPLQDSAGNERVILQAAIHALAQIIRGSVPTLVCCGVGMNRSPAIAAAALSLTDGIGLQDALALIAKCGPMDISPQLWHDISQAVKIHP